MHRSRRLHVSNHRSAVLVATVLTLGLVGSVGPSKVLADADPAVGSAAATAQPAANQQRGLVRKGLSPATSGTCRGAYEIRLDGGEVLCTHGPDAAPPGTDVTRKPSTRELRTALASVSATSSSVPCVGDGVSGPRIQAIYAVADPARDRFATVAPLIRQHAANMDEELSLNAQAAGSDRHLRWVTKPDCTLDIDRVVLSSTGDDSFGNTIDELQALGYDRSDRKYHVWFDADVYCGIGSYWPDDSPGASNRNERAVTYARTDTACWGYAELHEVFHNLGTVMTSAPNSDGNGHCTDEKDLMCYGPGVVQVCPAPPWSSEWIDCNHDDYFNVSPRAGSYLASHWNTADSIYMTGSLTEPPAAPGGVTANALGESSVRLSWDDVPAEDGYRIRCGDSMAVCKGGLPAGTTTSTVTGLAAGTRHTFKVCAYTDAGEACSAKASATTTGGASVPTTNVIVDDGKAGFSKQKGGWKRQSVGWGKRSLWTTVRKSSPYRSAKWEATLDGAGRYTVYVRFPRSRATTRQARYKVHHADGRTIRKVDQATKRNTWAKLGTFDFTGVARVELNDKTGEKRSTKRSIVFDVVKLVPVDPTAGAVTARPAVTASRSSQAPTRAPESTPAPVSTTEPKATAEPAPSREPAPDATPEPTLSAEPAPTPKPTPVP